MEARVGLQSLIEYVDAAATLLGQNALAYPSLYGSSRAFRRVALLANRPFRIAILGEANSGKSTIANLIAGEMALPALPVANTRLPTLLHYAPVPYVEVVQQDGQRVSAAQSSRLSIDGIARLEVGLPRETLKRIEILDFPGSANPLFRTDLLAVLRHGIDAAIWTTVATQAWRETERLAWSGLPERVRKRGLLAVTHCDLLSKEDDMRKLKGRLETVEREHFSASCFVSASEPAPERASDLHSKVLALATEFETSRLEKAILLTRHLAAKAQAQVEREAEVTKAG